MAMYAMLEDNSLEPIVLGNPWDKGRIYFIASDSDLGPTTTVSVTFVHPETLVPDQPVDLDLPFVTERDGNFLYSFTYKIPFSFGAVSYTYPNEPAFVRYYAQGNSDLMWQVNHPNFQPPDGETFQSWQ